VNTYEVLTGEDRQSDRQTDRQTGRQTDRQTDRQIDGHDQLLNPT